LLIEFEEKRSRISCIRFHRHLSGVLRKESKQVVKNFKPFFAFEKISIQIRIKENFMLPQLKNFTSIEKFYLN